MSATSVSVFLQNLITKVEGLQTIVISDSGHPILTVPADSDTGDFGAASTYCIVSEQANKLGLGKNRSLTLQIEDHVIVLFNLSPVVVSFIGATTLNVGLILSMTDLLSAALQPLQEELNAN